MKIYLTLLPRIQVHALIYVAEAKVHASESKFDIFRRREKLTRFIYKCMPQIFKLTIKQKFLVQSYCFIARFVLKTKEIFLM